MRRLLFSVFLVMLVSGAACTNIYTPTPSIPTSTLPPLATFTPRYTATPVPTSSPRPTFTYTPSVTPVPPTASNTPTPTPTPPIIGRVSTVQDAVNMREGPGVTFPAIVGVVNNTDLIVLASNEEQTWYNVRLEDGTEGWIAANLIFVLPSPTPEPTLTVPGVVVQVSGTPLATSLLGGLPVTATPSFTPVVSGTEIPAGIPTRRLPGTLSPTPSVTATLEPGASIPTVTPGSGTPSATAARTESSVPRATSSGPAQLVRGLDVLAYCEAYNEVPPPLAAGSTIDVFWGWVASTREYVQQHVNNVNYEVTFDGQILSEWRTYADQIRQDPDGNYSIYWYVPITEPLEPGTHTIRYRVSWRNPIFDGYKSFGPGTETEFETFSCTFEVR